MSGWSPSWAMSGQAIDGVDDTHLAKGNHLRLVSNPLLGLPICPLVVQRVPVHVKQLMRWVRTDVIWVDSRGQLLSTPFTITADNPVTGYLPAPACWVQVDADPRSIEIDRGAVVGPLRDTVLTHRKTTLREVAIDPIRERLTKRTIQHSSIRVEALVGTPLGDAPVAVRSRAPYQVYASHIERVVVTGSGVVSRLSWLSPERVPAGKPWRTLPLPCKPGARYAGPGDGWDRGIARARDAAPSRYGLHEQPHATGPAACDPLDPGDETARVEHLAHGLVDELDRLVNDTSASQQELTESAAVTGVGGGTGTSARNLLATLLQATLDHGIAHWLPFADLDQDEFTRDEIVIYRVSAAFAPDMTSVEKLGLQGSLPGPTDPWELIDQLREQVDENWDGGEAIGRAMVLEVVLVAPVGVPLDLPSAPPMSVTWDGTWQSMPPPDASRRLRADLERLVAGAALASAIRQPAGDPAQSRHVDDGSGRLMLLGPSQPPTATAATQGRLTDRGVGPEAGSWQIAQADWFGRWSGWAVRPFAEASRPRPPRPVVMLTTAPPTIASPAPTGPLAGSVRIGVPVPPAGSLPAGGRALDHVRLSVTLAPGGTTTHTAPASGAEVVVTLPGPLLMPTVSGTVTVTARWIDTAGAASDPSEPRTGTLHDPRAPAPVVLPAELTYTARPDATGWAQTTLSWGALPGQAAFRVFVADETTLRSKLADIAAGDVTDGDVGQAPTPAQAQALLSDLDTAPGAPERGAVWETHKTRLPRRWFLQVTPDPIPAASTTYFRHQVSGSLDVLVLYRVVAVSHASVESDFRTSPMLPRAVPHALAPPAPSIQVRPVTTAAGELQARIAVTVPSGPTPAARWRLRRATATSDAALMAVVGEGAVTAATTSETGDQVFEIVDDGAAPGVTRTSLSAWFRYVWRVEVTGPDLPGGGPSGEWSAPSAPASAVVMPDEPPAQVSGLTAVRDAVGVHVQFTHPGPLAPGTTTGYVVDVYRRRPGEAPRLATSVAGHTAAGGVFDVVDPDAAVPPGTAYRVIVTDPIGRRAAPSEEVSAP